MNAIEVNGVSKCYGQVKALNGVSFSVAPGEVFGLIGPDGAGKTTMFRILCSLLLPDAGTASVDGFDVVREMKQGFAGEMLTITLISAVAIFIVVAVAFRSFVIPAILVLVVQCGVYLTILAIGIQGYHIYYLAMLIVQCILMGATIDYGILLTNMYREARREVGVRDAIGRAYDRSINTIMTSGLIMILVTAAIALTSPEPTIGQICQTISMGATSAVILIMLFLPGILAALDRFTSGRR